MKGFFSKLHKNKYRLVGLARLFVVAGFAALLIIFDQFFYSRTFFVFLVAAIITIWIGVRFIDDLFDFRNRRMAFWYLFALLFGIRYPTYEIANGKKKALKEEMNWLDRAGGPCVLKIQADHAVLVEPLNAEPVVIYEGMHLLRPLDILRAILHTHDMKGKIEEVSTITKDGIRVAVRDIQFGYGVLTDAELRERIHSDHPVLRYSEDLALKAFVYYQPVSEASETNEKSRKTFVQAVENTIKGVIKNYIGAHLLDQITAPRYHKTEPRQDIAQMLLANTTQQRFAEMGSKLLWVDIGYFDIPDEDVERQRLQTWKVGWIGKAKVIQAYGEAHQLANQELGRSEAQADMLNGILHALGDIGLKDDANRKQNLKKLILVKTAQILESMTSLYQESDKIDNNLEK